MAQQVKIDAVLELKTKLEKRSNFILASYSGLTVEDMSNLRAKLSAEDSEMKVVKNNLFLRALKESDKHKGKSIEFGDAYKGQLRQFFQKKVCLMLQKFVKIFQKIDQCLMLNLDI